MMPYVWPKNSSAKGRISVAMGLLLAGKILNVQVPYLFKEIVEQVNTAMGVDAVNLDLFTVSGAALLGCKTY